MLVTIF